MTEPRKDLPADDEPGDEKIDDLESAVRDEVGKSVVLVRSELGWVACDPDEVGGAPFLTGPWKSLGDLETAVQRRTVDELEPDADDSAPEPVDEKPDDADAA